MVGESKKSSTRYNQLKLAQEILKLKEGEKLASLRNQFTKEMLMSNEPWKVKEIKLLINLIYNNDKSIPKRMLEEIGTNNPLSLARILVLDLLKIKSKKKIEPRVVANSTDHSKTETIVGDRASYFIKIAFMGDKGVGKKTIRYSMLGRGFRTEHLMTIGADFATTDFEMKLGNEFHKFTFQIWALAEDNCFATVRQRFFRGAYAGLIIFDISDESSFMSIPKWIEELWRNCGRGVVPIAIVGNKSDLRLENPQNYPLIERERIIEYCEAISNKVGFPVPYIEVSAIYKIGRKEMLSFLAKAILYKLRVSEFIPEQGNHILINDHIFEN
jgi:small GTP-binding protein